jgi:hypothetical protein
MMMMMMIIIIIIIINVTKPTDRNVTHKQKKAYKGVYGQK